MVRNAIPSDIPGMLECAKRAHAASEYKDIPTKDLGFKQMAAYLIGNAKGCALVMERHGRIRGFVLGEVQPIGYLEGNLATASLLYADEGAGYAGALLVRRFIAWARSQKRVVDISMAISSGIGDPEAVAEIYEREGLKRMGSWHMQLIPENLMR